MVLSACVIFMGNTFYGRCHIVLLKYPILDVELSVDWKMLNLLHLFCRFQC